MRMILVLALMVWSAPTLARENFALLIGANTYPSLDERYWLKGPANDVALVAEYLTTSAPVPFAAENVTVLADGIEGGQPPTLAAIRAAFAGLAQRVQPGDFVYLHFSGHGSQAPAADPDSELDELDEMFLPVDIGPWSDETAAVQNALVDDEIGAMIDSLRAKGADVWAVFDSCHSGTATRAAPSGDDEVRSRALPPEALGVDVSAVATRGLPDPRAPEAPPLDAGGAAGGSLVAFFAAQTNEVTPEKNLPKGKSGRRPQGVFTWTLFEVLAEHPGASYAEIGQEVLRRYAVGNLARSTPLFEGDLDKVAFSGAPGARVAQWPATVTQDGFSIPAGSLHGLAAGSLLAVLGSAADPLDAALGYAEVVSVDRFSAEAVAVDHEGKVLPVDLPKGLVLRKLSSDLDYTLTVALAEAMPAGVAEALAGAGGPRLRIVPAGAEADLRLAMIPESPRPDAIWILPSTGLVADYARTPSVSTSGKDATALAAALAQVLGQMAKALNLLKLGESVGAGDLDVEVELLMRTPEDRVLRGLPVAGVPRLIPDDEVHLLATNRMDVPVDVNVLYVGSDYSISHMFAGRLQPGDRLKKGLLRITDDVFGRDRVVLVLTPAAPQSPVEDLGFLAQDAVEMTRGGGAGLAAALREAGFGETTRGAISLADEEEEGPGPAILQFDLDTVPAD